jgi:hypothetical protein
MLSIKSSSLVCNLVSSLHVVAAGIFFEIIIKLNQAHRVIKIF